MEGWRQAGAVRESVEGWRFSGTVPGGDTGPLANWMLWRKKVGALKVPGQGSVHAQEALERMRGREGRRRDCLQG